MIAGGNWVSGSNNYQIYDLVFTNTGSKTITKAELAQGLGVGYPSQWWGLNKTCCLQIRSAITYDITIPYPLAVGSSLNAGYPFEKMYLSNSRSLIQ